MKLTSGTQLIIVSLDFAVMNLVFDVEPTFMDRDRHQAALDGVRGFAALSVMLYHIGHWLDGSLAPNSGLAVDLFFLLSGYVLTLAYARRLDVDMTVGHFLMVRLVRLMPLVALGTLISAIYTILRIYIKNDNISIFDLLITTFFGTLNIPFFSSVVLIGGNQVFSLNGPQYSLFFEMFANFFWAFAAVFRKGINSIVLSGGFFIIIFLIGDLGGDTPDTFISGFPRVSASFLAGVAVFRLESILPPWRGWPIVFGTCCTIMIATFYAPPLPFGANLLWVMTVSPLTVLSGSRTAVHGPARTLSLIGGRMSYPIYILHYPLFAWVNGLFQAVTHKHDIAIEGIALTITVISASFITLRFYDEPIRDRLNRMMNQGARSANIQLTAHR